MAGQALLFPSSPEVPWIEREGDANFRLAHVAGKLAGGLSVQPLGQWFGGRVVGTGGVRAVAVAPEFRGRGIARALVRASLIELHQAGVPLSTLYPATHLVYRRMGYELAGVRTGYRLPTHALPAGGRELAVVELGRTRDAALESCYAERARRTNGQLERNELMWQRVLDPLGAGETYAYAVVGDGVEAYVVFNQSRLAGSFRGTIMARDLVVRSRRGALAVLGLLAEHRSVIDSVEWFGAPQEPLLLLLDNPAHSVIARQDWMLRLVDVAGAFAARGYAPGVTGEVHLEVSDDVLPWNQDRFVLSVAQGRGEVRCGGEGRIRVDVRALASIYTGYGSPEELQAVGGIAGPREDLALLGALFAGPAPWMPDMF